MPTITVSADALYPIFAVLLVIRYIINCYEKQGIIIASKTRLPWSEAAKPLMPGWYKFHELILAMSVGVVSLMWLYIGFGSAALAALAYFLVYAIPVFSPRQYWLAMLDNLEPLHMTEPERAAKLEHAIRDAGNIRH